METICAQYSKLLADICQWLKGHRITHIHVLALWTYGLDWLTQAIPLSIQDFKAGLLPYSSQSDP